MIFINIVLIFRKYKLHKKVTNLSETSYPGVTILKPLMGADPNLSSNLETFFTMLYPKVKDTIDYQIELLIYFLFFSMKSFFVLKMKQIPL